MNCRSCKKQGIEKNAVVMVKRKKHEEPGWFFQFYTWFYEGFCEKHFQEYLDKHNYHE